MLALPLCCSRVRLFNISDHLLIMASLQCPSPAVSAECRDGEQTIDWVKSRHLGLLDSYECRVRDSLVHSPASDVSCVDQVNEEVARFTDMLLGAAREESPLVQHGRRPQ